MYIQTCVFFMQRGKVGCAVVDIMSNSSDSEMCSFSNDCGTLQFHQQSLKGKMQDYVITFHKEEMEIKSVSTDTYVLFHLLMETFKDKLVRARLVAKVLFEHLGSEEVRHYHFGSYSTEVVKDDKEFFMRHMLKISQRLDEFNSHGSNLMMKAISHIHIQLTITESTLVKK